ncbi:MAG: NUDIX domain-containing protein [Alphaproteobacteria bacterium]|nr:NUDIX domain-containing protein [Alphaproteobacteria bacterium]
MWSAEASSWIKIILLAYDPRAHPNHYYELNTPFYYLPGGHIECQESAENALIREIKEGTGLDAEIEKLLGIIEHAWNFPGDEVCCHTHEINWVFKIHSTSLSFADTLPHKEDHVRFNRYPLPTCKPWICAPYSCFLPCPPVSRRGSRCFLQRHKT